MQKTTDGGMIGSKDPNDTTMGGCAGGRFKTKGRGGAASQVPKDTTIEVRQFTNRNMEELK